MYLKKGDSASFLYIRFSEQMKNGQVIGSTTSSAIGTTRRSQPAQANITISCEENHRNNYIWRASSCRLWLMVKGRNGIRSYWYRQELISSQSGPWSHFCIRTYGRAIGWPHLQYPQKTMTRSSAVSVRCTRQGGWNPRSVCRTLLDGAHLQTMIIPDSSILPESVCIHWLRFLQFQYAGYYAGDP